MIHTMQFKAMGCALRAVIDAPSDSRPRILEQVPLWFEEWEQSLSRFRPSSELNLLNASAGMPVRVSDTLWNVFQLALDAEWISGGLVTPAVMDALIAAGYDRSFEQIAIAHPAPFLPGERTIRRLDDAILDRSKQTITLPPGMRLDFGGVAKGWAAHEAASRLSGSGSALVNAGGDIAVSAPKLSGEGWDIDLDDPEDREASLGLLMIPRGGVATSGIDYRRWQNGEAWNHHLIDPRTGQPADTDVLTATVIAPTVMEAETAAKVAVISGSSAGLGWIESRPSLAGMMILQNGEQIFTSNFEHFLWREE